MHETRLDAFVERLRAALNIDRVDVHSHASVVKRIAIVAGGAGFPPMMQEAIDRGCDTYLTGDIRVRHGGPWADEHRPKSDAFVATVPINLIGASHYATEAEALRNDMLGWFNSVGLPGEFVSQRDPWR
jgi:putative NIF3 family GTP cyclohydrolase 1 type 2